MTTIILHSHIGKKGDLFPQQGAAQAEFKIPAAVQVRSQSNKNICVISTVRGKRCRRRSFKFRSTISGNYINTTTHGPPLSPAPKPGAHCLQRGATSNFRCSGAKFGCRVTFSSSRSLHLAFFRFDLRTFPRRVPAFSDANNQLWSRTPLPCAPGT